MENNNNNAVLRHSQSPKYKKMVKYYKAHVIEKIRRIIFQPNSSRLLYKEPFNTKRVITNSLYKFIKSDIIVSKITFGRDISSHCCNCLCCTLKRYNKLILFWIYVICIKFFLKSVQLILVDTVGNIICHIT